MKNGLRAAIPFWNKSKSYELDVYGIYTNFFQNAAVSSYFTIGFEVGHHFTTKIYNQDIDLGYFSLGFYSDIGNHYSSGHIKLGSAWKF
jgi:hypothetical protein